ncbi:thymosin beta-4-like isoform X2 [Limulus polyphemus]|nr:thymosin beta-4-like isoform X2 [Limulus polyphemus]XP_022250075.1 thymosin beta-4-like isoform X2 [Limulus polyphemus]XP_022250078.1 thymosin beta-4-like isoform X2 [Limulus polyphemus]
MSSPKKEDLPAVPSAMKDELANFDSGKMKHAHTVEKKVLPSTEEIKQEKEQQELLKGIKSYDPSKLRPTETQEKNELPTKETIALEKGAA